MDFRRSLHSIQGYLLAFLFLVILWQLCSFFLDRPFFPPPLEVGREFLSLTARGELMPHFAISSYRVMVSLGLSFLLAVPLGLVLGRTPTLDRIAAPMVYLLYPLPKVVFLPIIVILFGLGNMPKIILITLIVFFQILVASRDAAKDIPPQWLLSLKSLHASTWQTYRHLIWPACLPRIFTSLRVSLGTSIAVLFLAETFASSDGLGFYILDSMERRSYPAMYSGILSMALLGAVTYALVDFLENSLCRWNKL